jgi:hypothetical protein
MKGKTMTPTEEREWTERSLERLEHLEAMMAEIKELVRERLGVEISDGTH